SPDLPPAAFHGARRDPPFPALGIVGKILSPVPLGSGLSTAKQNGAAAAPSVCRATHCRVGPGGLSVGIRSPEPGRFQPGGGGQDPLPPVGALRRSGPDYSHWG